MTTYYVRKDGNDSTGDGSTGNPWLTVSKAMMQIPLAEHTLLIGDGVYEENYSGLGYLLVQRIQAVGAYLTIQPENGSSGDVTIDGSASTTYRVRFDNARYLIINYIKFISGTNQTAFAGQVTLTAYCSYLQFNNCTFTIRGVSGITTHGILADSQALMSNISFSNCEFNQETPTTSVGLIRMTSPTGNIDNITIEDCTFSADNNYCIWIYGADTVTIDTINAYNQSDNFGCVEIGMNADSGAGCSGVTVQNSVIESTVGHGLLIGAICTTVSVLNNYIYGGDQGLVLKHCDGVTATNNVISGGSLNAFYCKGAVNVTASFNTIINKSGNVFRVGASGDGTKCQNIDLQKNILVGMAEAIIFDWSEDIGDLGGGVCNYNTYSFINGSLGSVRGVDNITTVSALRAAWSGYDVLGNDSQSMLVGSTINNKSGMRQVGTGMVSM